MVNGPRGRLRSLCLLLVRGQELRRCQHTRDEPAAGIIRKTEALRDGSRLRVALFRLAVLTRGLFVRNLAGLFLRFLACAGSLSLPATAQEGEPKGSPAGNQCQ